MGSSPVNLSPGYNKFSPGPQTRALTLKNVIPIRKSTGTMKSLGHSTTACSRMFPTLAGKRLQPADKTVTLQSNSHCAHHVLEAVHRARRKLSLQTYVGTNCIRHPMNCIHHLGTRFRYQTLNGRFPGVSTLIFAIIHSFKCS